MVQWSSSACRVEQVRGPSRKLRTIAFDSGRRRGGKGTGVDIKSLKTPATGKAETLEGSMAFGATTRNPEAKVKMSWRDGELRAVLLGTAARAGERVRRQPAPVRLGKGRRWAHCPALRGNSIGRFGVDGLYRVERDTVGMPVALSGRAQIPANDERVV